MLAMLAPRPLSAAFGSRRQLREWPELTVNN
jgi:hypothetical protein